MALELSPQARATVLAILARHAPGVTVWAFGSRVHGRNLKRLSDLDLALVGDGPLPLRLLGDLRDAFEHSDLPILVDVVDLATVGPALRESIVAEHEVIQAGSEAR